MPAITHPTLLRQSLLKGLNFWVTVRGEVVFPCLGANLQAHLKSLKALFSALGQPFSPSEQIELSQGLARKLQQGLQNLPPGKLVVRYEDAPPPQSGLVCRLAMVEATASQVTGGLLSLPCVPALLDDYCQQIGALFAALGQPLSERELKSLRSGVAEKLTHGFSSSPYSRLLLRYQSAQPPQRGFVCQASVAVHTIADRCEYLVGTHSEPLFGRDPDAKVMAVASSLGTPATSPVLDVGAGTGRNTLPLARLGYPVDAMELAPAFVDRLQQDAHGEGLSVHVMQGNVLDRNFRLPSHRYRLAIGAEVVPHFSAVGQLRVLLEKMSAAIASGGWLLFSLFLAVEGYEPDLLAQQMSHVTDSFIFTRSQFAAAMAGLPLKLVSDEFVVEYEQSHLPPQAWPPTDWFVLWASGRRLFPLADGEPPIGLHWILCQRL